MKFSIQLAWRYLWGRKLRTFLTFSAIVFGVMIIFGINGVTPVMEASMAKSIRTSAHRIDLIITHKTGGIFNESTTEIVRDTPGIENVTPALERTIFLPAGLALKITGGKTINTLVVNGWDPATSTDVFPLRPFTGRWLEAGDDKVIVVRETLCRKTGLNIGDSMQLPAADGTFSFEIIGILPPSPMLGDENVYIPLETVQKLFNLPDQINGIGAQFTPGKENIRDAVLEKLGPGFNSGAINTGGNEWESFFKMINAMTTMVGTLALGMGGFIMFITFRTAVVERKRDIGMLRAIGASRRTVLKILLIEGLIQGGGGTVAGLSAGYILALVVVQLMNPVWLEFMHTPLGDPVFSLQTIVLAIILGVGIPLFSCLVPALSASRMSPLESMRPAAGLDAPRSVGKQIFLGALLIGISLLGPVTGHATLISLSILLFLTGLMILGPVLVHPISNIFGKLLLITFAREGQLARGNLERQPGRAAITALTITISLAILFTLAGFSTTMGKGMMGWMDTSIKANYLLLSEDLLLGKGNVEAGPDLAQKIRRTPGIKTVTTLRRSKTQCNNKSLQVIGLDPKTYPQVSGLTFSRGKPREVYTKLALGGYFIANNIFAAQNDLNVGEDFLMQTVEGPRNYRLAAVGIDYLNAAAPVVYISQADMTRDFHQTNDYLLMANRTADGVPGAVEEALLTHMKAYPAFTLILYDEWRRKQVELMNLRNTAMYAMMAMLAVPALIAMMNTLGINILERIREIGMLRAIGSTRGQIQRMILAESLLLAAMGVATGILAGIWLGYIAIEAMNGNGFPYEYYFPYMGILLTIATGIILGVLAALIPARHASRLNIVDAMRYR